MTVFSVMVDKPTRAQSDLITAHFKTGPYGWWHWIDGHWLVRDTSQALTATELRNQLKPFVAGRVLLVLQLAEGSTWAGNSKTTATKKPFAWLHKNFK